VVSSVEPLKRRILDRAEGNPFYVEEVIRSLIDSGAIAHDEASGLWEATRDVAEIPIPDTLHGVLLARIDRLQEEARRVLQMASVIGRIFLYRILEAIAEEERDLDELLITLQREELIRERARLPELEYIFKHELTRAAAYNGLLKRERRAFHRQVAEALERLFPERIEEQVELLAYHWEGAQNLEKALHYLRQAGDRAVRQSANQEAIAHFSRALALLETLPDTPDRAQQELALQLALAVPLLASSGYAAPELGRTYARARQLCQQIGETPQLFPTLLLLWMFYATRAEHQTAFELGEQILSLAQQVQDPVQVALANWAPGLTSLYLGEFTRARAHFEQMIAFYDPQQHRSLAFLYGQDPGATSLSWAAWALWFLGYSDQALRRRQEALALAQELDHPFTLGFVLGIGGLFHHLRREGQAARECYEESAEVATEEKLALFEAGGPIFLGWGQTEAGQVEEGIAQIRQGLAAWQAMGARMHLSHYLGMLAEAHMKAGQVEQGLSVLAEALAFVEKTDERYFEAEIHRLKGELLLMQGDEPEAEAEYHLAVEVARRQRAKSWELRATTSVSRLWQKQGKREEARRILAEAYGWFTEGFDTPDLEEAKALLEELS
jgi:predicted ATPase